MMLSNYLLPLLLFMPGPVFLYALASQYNIKLSKLEIILLGSTSWNFLLISFGYIVGIFSNLLGQFFVVFSVLSVSLLVFSAYLLKKSKIHFEVHFRFSSNDLLLISIFSLMVLIFVLTATHSIYIEYDAIFSYLPSAASVAKTGSLQYDYYHQTGLTTAQSPAMIIIYAWLNYFCVNPADFELVVRIIPFAYILLTALLVYLITKDISKNSTIALIASISFLSMPSLAAVALHFSLYFDIPFTFALFLSLFVLQKIYSKQDNRSFWWLMLGMVSSLMLLEKGISYLIFPALAALIFVPTILRLDKKLRVVSILILAILFTAAYNFFFVWDIFHPIVYTMGGLIDRQIPVLVILVIFSLLLLKISKDDYTAPRPKLLILFSIPLVPVLIYLLRNLLSFGAITYELPLFNADWKLAFILINQASTPTTVPMNFTDFLRWDILFASLGLGAIFLTPLIIGLFRTISSFVRKEIEGKNYFLIISFFLILLTVWSWAFECSYQGPELRRLYYFSPLISIFAAMGVHTIIEYTKSTKSAVPRFTIFNSFIFIYLWGFKFDFSSLNIQQLSSLLSSLNIASVEMLLAFAFFFFLSFYPLDLSSWKITITRCERILTHVFRWIFPLTLIILVISLVMPFSYTMLSNTQEGIRYVYPHWENDLSEVISYVNNEIKDNYTIITCYALPLAHFTNHPVIELTLYDGIISLFSLNNSNHTDTQVVNNLLKQNVRYLLFPKPGHNYYQYFVNLSKNFSILSPDFINKNWNIFLLKEFSKFRLYKVLTPKEVSNTYKYLTSFEKGWTPLNNFSRISNSTEGVSIYSNSIPLEVIADDNQQAFWETGKADPKDEITISNELQTKLMGTDSLKIYVNGTKNMVIGHSYSTYQNFSSLSIFNMYLYGAYTNKSITVTFHTTRWVDYYSMSIEDDFIGWKKSSLPLEEFSVTGDPSWSKIIYIEILLGNRIATYYIDQISLGYAVGLQVQLSPINTNSSAMQMIISIKEHNLQYPAEISLTSIGRGMNQNLVDGINLIAIPSDLLKEGATLRIYYLFTNTEEELSLYYFAILQP